MGAWGTGIKDNDTSSDVYEDFMADYNDGAKPEDISARLIADYAEDIADPDTANDFWFALALAQWETKSLDKAVLEKVTLVIESGADLQVWKNLDASASDLKKRQAKTELFLQKLGTEKARPKSRKKWKAPATPPFETGDCVVFKLENGNYGGFAVLGTSVEHGLNLIATTCLNQPDKPSLQDFEKTHVLHGESPYSRPFPQMSWRYAEHYQEFAHLYETIGQMRVVSEHNDPYMSGSGIGGGGWPDIVTTASRLVGEGRDANKRLSLQGLASREPQDMYRF